MASQRVGLPSILRRRAGRVSVLSHLLDRTPPPEARVLVVHALLDSPSTTGAYRWTIRPGDPTVMDVELTLYPRVALAHVGLAPLTSMFFFGPHDRQGIDDFRSSVHDSEGLAIWNGREEWLWRPLINPDTLQTSVFLDANPRGFGLVQRRRAFTDYQDLEARYERRPSLWVEPIGDWGQGAVQLVEIPSKSESNDNIVAFWHPQHPLPSDVEYRCTYRLHWCWTPPVVPTQAITAATRTGAGPEPNTRRFIIDFVGGVLPSSRTTPQWCRCLLRPRGRSRTPWCTPTRPPAGGGSALYWSLAMLPCVISGASCSEARSASLRSGVTDGRRKSCQSIRDASRRGGARAPAPSGDASGDAGAASAPMGPTERVWPDPPSGRARRRRTLVLTCVLALTAGASYEMYRVLTVHSMTTLQLAFLVLFTLTFVWIALPCVCGLAGLLALWRGRSVSGLSLPPCIPSQHSRPARRW